MCESIVKIYWPDLYKELEEQKKINAEKENALAEKDALIHELQTKLAALQG